MNEEQVRNIVREEIQKNYRDGSPSIPPHSHNGVDNLKIQIPDLDGANLFAKTGAGMYANLHQNIYGESATIPLPIIAGRGVGADGSFNGGNAPDGTIFFFIGAGGKQLWVAFNSDPTQVTTWYGVNLPLTA